MNVQFYNVFWRPPVLSCFYHGSFDSLVPGIFLSVTFTSVYSYPIHHLLRYSLFCHSLYMTHSKIIFLFYFLFSFIPLINVSVAKSFFCGFHLIAIQHYAFDQSHYIIVFFCCRRYS